MCGGLDYSCDSVLEDVLQSAHCNIAEVDLSDNPHGVDGIRCLLRCLVSNDCSVP